MRHDQKIARKKIPTPTTASTDADARLVNYVDVGCGRYLLVIDSYRYCIYGHEEAFCPSRGSSGIENLKNIATVIIE